MADVLLTFHCAAQDAEAVIEAVRPLVAVPIHLREEQVFGRDFVDANTAERVAGTLRRAAVELIVAADQLEALVGAAAASRRRLPMRWHATPLIASGREA